MKYKSTALILVAMILLNVGTVALLYQFRAPVEDPTSKDTPVVYLEGSFNYTVYEGDCSPDEIWGYMLNNSYSMYIGNDAIAAVLKSCATIDEGSLVLTGVWYQGHNYVNESSVLYGDYEVVITFKVGG